MIVVMDGPFFFSSSQKSIFGFMHSSKIKPRRSTGIIICSPHAEEKLTSHRIFYNLMSDLSENGFDCLRFDYYGHGDSHGEFSEMTIQSMITDILSAVTLMTNHGHSQICLVGCRLGATLSAMAAHQENRIRKLVLINPIINVKDYLYECLRGNLSSQLLVHKKVVRDTKTLVEDIRAGKQVNYFGYEMTQRFFNEAISIRLDEILTKLKCNILDVQIIKRKKTGKPPSFFLEMSNLTYKELMGIHFWFYNRKYEDKSNALNDAILDWLKEQ